MNKSFWLFVWGGMVCAATGCSHEADSKTIKNVVTAGVERNISPGALSGVWAIEAQDAPQADSNLKAPQYHYVGKLHIKDGDEVTLQGPIRIERLDESVSDTLGAMATGNGVVYEKMYMGSYTMDIKGGTKGFGSFALKFKGDTAATGYFVFKATAAQQDFGIARAHLRRIR